MNERKSPNPTRTSSASQALPALSAFIARKPKSETPRGTFLRDASVAGTDLDLVDKEVIPIGGVSGYGTRCNGSRRTTGRPPRMGFTQKKVEQWSKHSQYPYGYDFVGANPEGLVEDNQRSPRKWHVIAVPARSDSSVSAGIAHRMRTCRTGSWVLRSCLRYLDLSFIRAVAGTAVVFFGNFSYVYA